MDLLRVFTAFSGYDSQCMALDRLGIQYELVGWSEIDKYAIKAHDAIYPQFSERNFGDISKIDWKNVPDFDLFTYSFPCTDISTAGQQKGLEEGSGTRSSLLWECRKAIELKKPKYLLLENVKALTHKKFIPYLMKWMEFLEELGYSNFAKVLNARDYGVPQNRQSLFVVSILDNKKFEFPKTIKLEKCLNDILENKIDDWYINHPANIWITTKDGERCIKTKFAAIDPYVSNCITARGFISWNCTYVTRPNGNITMITNREVFRLMGVSEKNIDIIFDTGISHNRMYFMAGNSIVVDVLYYIFKNLFFPETIKKENLF